MTVHPLDDLVGSLERVPVAAAPTELESRRVVAVNERAQVVLGYPTAEPVGPTFSRNPAR